MLDTATRSDSAATVYDHLRSAIIAGELPSGTPLRQAELGARYGVSKIPVREALRQLEAQGFVALFPGRGAVVASMTAAEAEEIYLMRVALEPILLLRSVPNLSPLDFARADATLHLVESMDELAPADWHKLDGEFHTIMYQAAPLPLIQRQVNTLRGNLARYFSVFTTLGESFQVTGHHEHRQILSASKAGDLEAASCLLVAHLERSAEELLDALHSQIPA